MPPYDWDEDELYGESWFSEEDETALMEIIDREREAQMAAEIEAVQTYIDGGISAFERLLANHAAFDAYLAEGSEASA